MVKMTSQLRENVSFLLLLLVLHGPFPVRYELIYPPFSWPCHLDRSTECFLVIAMVV
jgi:hypothetical protein